MNAAGRAALDQNIERTRRVGLTTQRAAALLLGAPIAARWRAG